MVTRPASRSSRKPKSEPKPESHLIDRLHIEGYRCFKKYTVGDLRRVNLFVGPNNCGKTALLEAAQLASKANDLNAAICFLVENARRRGEVFRETDNVLKADLSHAFYGHSSEPGTRLSIDGGKTTKSLIVSLISSDKLSRPLDLTARFGIGMKLEAATSQEDIPLTTGGLFPPDLESWPPIWARSTDAGASMVPLGGLSGGGIRQSWDQTLQESRERLVVEALRLIEPRTSDIAFLTQSLGQGEPGAGVLIELEGLDRKTPLGSMGDGMVRALSIALALVRAANGTVMIDEIDTGIHYSKMGSLWQFIVECARRFDVQVFATTHSLDCIRGLEELGWRTPDLFDDVAVHLLDRRLKESVPIHGKGLEISLKQHIEMRG